MIWVAYVGLGALFVWAARGFILKRLESKDEYGVCDCVECRKRQNEE